MCLLCACKLMSTWKWPLCGRQLLQVTGELRIDCDNCTRSSTSQRVAEEDEFLSASARKIPPDLWFPWSVSWGSLDSRTFRKQLTLYPHARSLGCMVNTSISCPYSRVITGVRESTTIRTRITRRKNSNESYIVKSCYVHRQCSPDHPSKKIA